jgi:hypothetical protein
MDTEAESAQLSLSTCCGVLKQLAEMDSLKQNPALKAAAHDLPRITMGTVPGTVREVIRTGICRWTFAAILTGILVAMCTGSRQRVCETTRMAIVG